jgi:nitrate/nitrite-specific signal transduction histidine kinase
MSTILNHSGKFCAKMNSKKQNKVGVGMSLRLIKWFTILFPPLIIGGFEYVRHTILEDLSENLGNLIITLLTLIISYLFVTWMFKIIGCINQRLGEEQAKRAVFEERERLARELHDNIAQILFFLNVSLKKGKVEEARSAITEIDNHLRQAIFNLRSNPEQGVLFHARIQMWLEDWSRLTGIEVSQELSILPGSITNKEEIQLFAVIQEAFTNIRKHSLATKAIIQLTAERYRWALVIQDNGQGMVHEVQDVPDLKKYGLSIIRKRCDELGATFSIKNVEEGGTKLQITREEETSL